MTDKSKREIKEHIMMNTDEIKDVKHEVWANIEREIESDPIIHKNKGNNSKWIMVVSLATLIILMLGTFFTDTGQALIQSIQDMFEKEKVIDINIEGDSEETKVELGLNEQLSYAIYVDTSRYKLINQAQGDQIVPSEEFEGIPPVMMEIMKKDNTTQAAEIKRIKAEINALEMEITLEEQVTMPFDGIVISAIGKGADNTNGENGMDWDSPVYRYYVMEEQDNTLFLIEEKYFLEAAEGHGSRFHSMLETFEIIVEK